MTIQWVVLIWTGGEVAKRNLDKPNVRYPNGRMSHDVERENLNRSESELYDLMLDGEFDAWGRFVRFADEMQS